MKKYRSSEARTSILSLRPRACREGSNLYNKKAFSLIELLIVIAILGILFTIAILMYNRNTLQAKDVKTRSSVDDLTIALQLYEDDFSEYPISTLNGTVPKFEEISGTSYNLYIKLATLSHVYMKSTNTVFNSGSTLKHLYRSTDDKGTGYMILWELASTVTNAKTVTDVTNLPVGKTNIILNISSDFYGVASPTFPAYFIYKNR